MVAVHCNRNVHAFVVVIIMQMGIKKCIRVSRFGEVEVFSGWNSGSK